ncbi:MAG: hypothetical protein WA510_13570, partial [Acidobacteriaceae bacterium]
DLSSRPKRSEVERSAVCFMEKQLSPTNRFVVSTEPGFPDTPHPTRQRMRLSVKERRMKLASATTSTGNPG